MWPILFYGILALSLLGWLYTALRQARRIRLLERSNEEIQVEETLVFDFLHGLGEAFTETIRPHDLHRLIFGDKTVKPAMHSGEPFRERVQARGPNLSIRQRNGQLVVLAGIP